MKSLRNVTAAVAFASTLALAGLAGAAPAVKGAEVVVDNGDSSNRYDIVFVGDGYTAEEMGRYKQDVAAAVETLFSTSPYREYRSYVNIHRIDVVSAESGYSTLNEEQKDTAFGCTYGYSFRYLRGDKSLIERTAAVHARDVDVICCLVNTFQGGTSFGKVCYAGSSGLLYGDDVVTHELGHSIAGLADEYVTEDIEVPGFLTRTGEVLGRPILRLMGWDFPNATAATGRGSIPWSHWIKESTPLPTPSDVDECGIHEGALYLPKNMYRPRSSCLMRHSDTFCEPCREAMVLALSKKVVPFDFHVEERDDGFALNFTHIVPGPVRARWFVGNRQVSQGADRIFVSRDQIGRLGTAVDAELQDATAFVRKDSQRVLIHGYEWRLRKPFIGNDLMVTRSRRRARRSNVVMRWAQSTFNPLLGDWSEQRRLDRDTEALLERRRVAGPGISSALGGLFGGR